MKKLINSRKGPILQMAAWVLTIGLLAGCASNQKDRGDYGTLDPSSEVSEIFQTYQVLPKYNYYFTGSETKPQAIIGIDRNYVLDTRLWKETPDLTSEQLKKWVDQMLLFLPPAYTFGAYIQGADGQRVGIWFSPYNTTTVKQLADNQIEIVPPSYARGVPMPGTLRGLGFDYGPSLD